MRWRFPWIRGSQAPSRWRLHCVDNPIDTRTELPREVMQCLRAGAGFRTPREAAGQFSPEIVGSSTSSPEVRSPSLAIGALNRGGMHG
jgi:hypothetical protein